MHARGGPAGSELQGLAVGGTEVGVRGRLGRRWRDGQDEYLDAGDVTCGEVDGLAVFGELTYSKSNTGKATSSYTYHQSIRRTVPMPRQRVFDMLGQVVDDDLSPVLRDKNTSKST